MAPASESGTPSATVLQFGLAPNGTHRATLEAVNADWVYLTSPHFSPADLAAEPSQWTVSVETDGQPSWIGCIAEIDAETGWMRIPALLHVEFSIGTEVFLREANSLYRLLRETAHRRILQGESPSEADVIFIFSESSLGYEGYYFSASQQSWVRSSSGELQSSDVPIHPSYPVVFLRRSHEPLTIASAGQTAKLPSWTVVGLTPALVCVSVDDGFGELASPQTMPDRLVRVFAEHQGGVSEGTPLEANDVLSALVGETVVSYLPEAGYRLVSASEDGALISVNDLN